MSCTRPSMSGTRPRATRLLRLSSALPLPTRTVSCSVALQNPPAPLTVGSVEAFPERLPAQPPRGQRGLHPRLLHGHGACLPPRAESRRASCCRTLPRQTCLKVWCWAVCCPARPSAWVTPKKNATTTNVVGNRLMIRMEKTMEKPTQNPAAPHRRRRRRGSGNGGVAAAAQQPAAEKAARQPGSRQAAPAQPRTPRPQQGQPRPQAPAPAKGGQPKPAPRGNAPRPAAVARPSPRIRQRPRCRSHPVRTADAR